MSILFISSILTFCVNRYRIKLKHLTVDEPNILNLENYNIDFNNEHLTIDTIDIDKPNFDINSNKSTNNDKHVGDKITFNNLRMYQNVYKIVFSNNDNIVLTVIFDTLGDIIFNDYTENQIEDKIEMSLCLFCDFVLKTICNIICNCKMSLLIKKHIAREIYCGTNPNNKKFIAKHNKKYNNLEYHVKWIKIFLSKYCKKYSGKKMKEFLEEKPEQVRIRIIYDNKNILSQILLTKGALTYTGPIPHIVSFIDVN